MRLFIAVEAPEEVKEYIVQLQEHIKDSRSKIKFTDKNQIHLTLKFLGKVQPHIAEEVKNILKTVKFKPFSVYLDKIGFFPSESYISVVWVGLEPENPVLDLQKDIDEKLKNLFDKEKDFKAHITLARIKYTNNKEEFIKKLKNIKVEKKKIEVRSFKLVKSNLTPLGPVYEDLEVFGQKG
jgi:RNA 2',3'-cyclic 3'-phosphodiesterase